MTRWAGAARPDAGNSAIAMVAQTESLLSARILVLAPHMDDETLGCGGTVLLHSAKADVHFFFATDGAASPVPLLSWTAARDASLPEMRRREAHAVAESIGIPDANLHFANLPDGKLAARANDTRNAVRDVIQAARPAMVLAPFRFDVHPDHIGLNRATRSVLRSMDSPPKLLEYFVYYRMPFVPGGDIRFAIDPLSLFTVDTAPVANAKRNALDCYRSQTTLLYPWQKRPILTAESLDRRCAEPEYYMAADPHGRLSEGLGPHAQRIRLACLAMRYGKPAKERLREFLVWIAGR